MKKITRFLANLAIKSSLVILGKLKTIVAASQADLGTDCRVLNDGSISNLHGGSSAIQIGAHGRIRGEILTFPHAGRVKIGDWFYCGPRSMIWSSDPQGITIGSRVLIAPDVLIHDTNSHPLDAAERFAQTRTMITVGHPRDITSIRSAPVTIGDDVWIATRAIVLKGVTIGDRAIIGAGAVICTDVAPDTLVPAGTVLRRGVQT